MTFDLLQKLRKEGWREVLKKEASPEKHIERFQLDLDEAQVMVEALAIRWSESKANKVRAKIWSLMHQIKRYNASYKPKTLAELKMISKNNGGVEEFMQILDEIAKQGKHLGFLPSTRIKPPPDRAVDEAFT